MLKVTKRVSDRVGTKKPRLPLPCPVPCHRSRLAASAYLSKANFSVVSSFSRVLLEQAWKPQSEGLTCHLLFLGTGAPFSHSKSFPEFNFAFFSIHFLISFLTDSCWLLLSFILPFLRKCLFLLFKLITLPNIDFSSCRALEINRQVLHTPCEDH